jgi:hypothetical protein
MRKFPFGFPDAVTAFETTQEVLRSYDEIECAQDETEDPTVALACAADLPGPQVKPTNSDVSNRARAGRSMKAEQ